MLKPRVEAILNAQIQKEGYSSNLYLAMASWAEKCGYNGTSLFLYQQAGEERMHMLKLFNYINSRGGVAKVPAIEEPPSEYNSVTDLFQQVLSHEQYITESINDIVGVCFEERDFTTSNYIQWYVNEQIEEEATAQKVLDRLKMLGEDKSRMYLFDKDMETIRTASTTTTNSTQA